MEEELLLWRVVMWLRFVSVWGKNSLLPKWRAAQKAEKDAVSDSWKLKVENCRIETRDMFRKQEIQILGTAAMGPWFCFTLYGALLHPHTRDTDPAQPGPPQPLPSVIVTPLSFPPHPHRPPLLWGRGEEPVSPGHHGVRQAQHPLGYSSPAQHFPANHSENDYTIWEIHQGERFPLLISRSKPGLAEATFFLLRFPRPSPGFFLFSFPGKSLFHTSLCPRRICHHLPVLRSTRTTRITTAIRPSSLPVGTARWR